MRFLFLLIPDFLIEILARSGGYAFKFLRPGSEGNAEGRIRGLLMGPRFGGRSTLIGRHVLIEGASKMDFGHNVHIHSGIHLTAGRSGFFRIGDNSHISRLSVISASGGISIGKNCAISSHVAIYSVSNSADGKTDSALLPTRFDEVRIGDGVFIGNGVTILPGRVIGDRAIIGAGAVVTQDVAEGETVVGVPARPAKRKKTSGCQNRL